MPERLIGFFQPVADKWNNLDRTQKIRIAAAALVVLIALTLTVFFMTRTVYQVAIWELTPIDANQVSVILDENNIRNRQVQHGLGMAVEVDQNRVNDARVLIETRGIVEDRNFSYQDALDLSGIGTTETVTRNNLLRARQHDLEQAIRAMDSVIWAQVELALPDANRFFIQVSDPAQASIMVRTTRRLNPTEARGIAVFVRNSVLGLELENIEVVDTDFNILFSGQAIEDEDSLLSELQEIMVSERVRVAGELRNLFRHNFDAVEVGTNLVYTQTITETDRRILDLPVEDADGGVVLTERTLNASARGQQTAFEPGVGSNNLVIPSYPFGFPADMQAQQAEVDRVFGFNELNQVIREIPNSFERENSSATVALTNFVTHRQESMMRQNGGNFTQDDWEDHVRNTRPELVLDELLVNAYTAMARTATGIDNITIAIWNVPYFIDYEPTPVALNQIIMYAILALLLGLLAFGLIRRTQPEEDDEIEPELSVEDLLVSTQMEEAIEDEMLDPIGYEEGSEAKKKIDEFIEDKPEAAASLLRHWINEAEI